MKPKLTCAYLGQRVEKRKGAPDWRHFAWTVTLEYNGRTMDSSWRAGMAHCDARTKWQLSPERRGTQNYYTPGTIAYVEIEKRATGMPPKLFDVLYSLCLDARSYDDARNFSDWSADYGYSDDSIEAKAIYEKCGAQAKELRSVLGRALYDELCAMDEDAIKAWCEAGEAVQS